MGLLQEDFEYFQKGKAENAKFWRRLFGKPDLSGKSVLDLGCGHGSLCVELALSGAKKVVGLDLDSRRIQFARENVRLNYPELSHRMTFHEIPLVEYDVGRQFDMLVSKDSFEHILDIGLTLQEMKKRLKTGGKVYIGFGPLYNSPFGDHRRTHAIIPWGHVLLPESFLLKRTAKKLGKPIHTVQELGLNKLALQQYKQIFTESGFFIAYFKVNCSERAISKLFSLLGKIPGLEEYFSHNIYCILKNNDAT